MGRHGLVDLFQDTDNWLALLNVLINLLVL